MIKYYNLNEWIFKKYKYIKLQIRSRQPFLAQCTSLQRLKPQHWNITEAEPWRLWVKLTGSKCSEFHFFLCSSSAGIYVKSFSCFSFGSSSTSFSILHFAATFFFCFPLPTVSWLHKVTLSTYNCTSTHPAPSMHTAKASPAGPSYYYAKVEQ